MNWEIGMVFTHATIETADYSIRPQSVDARGYDWCLTKERRRALPCRMITCPYRVIEQDLLALRSYEVLSIVLVFEPTPSEPNKLFFYLLFDGYANI